MIFAHRLQPYQMPSLIKSAFSESNGVNWESKFSRLWFQHYHWELPHSRPYFPKDSSGIVWWKCSPFSFPFSVSKPQRDFIPRWSSPCEIQKMHLTRVSEGLQRVARWFFFPFSTRFRVWTVVTDLNDDLRSWKLLEEAIRKPQIIDPVKYLSGHD